MIWNAPYRPDLNGIEFFWGRIKRAYRKEITRLRGQGLDWDQQELVDSLIKSVGFPCARQCAAQGWRNLRKAELKPVQEPQEPERIPESLSEDDVGHRNGQSSGSQIHESQDGEEEEDLPPMPDVEDAPLMIQQVGEDSEAAGNE